MSIRERLSGNEAVAFAMKQINPDVVAAFPITPSTEIPQYFSNYVDNGEVDTEFIAVEGENSANGETYAEILKQLDSEHIAKLYVDNVVRFMSEITMLDLRDILVKYLTAFYKFMKARDYKPDTYFKNLIKSMTGIDGITHYNDLNSKVFNKSTHKTLLANGKFLVALYALKNSYKYFLDDEKDVNKEELTKIYNLVFAMGSADIQRNGTIVGLYKFDKEQLNSLVKRNFFTSIDHLKSINDRTKPLIKTAPRYKDNLTKSFGYKFDLRGISGYSLDNDRVLYVPENSTGDWNSIGVSNDKEIGSFFVVKAYIVSPIVIAVVISPARRTTWFEY